MLGGCALAPIDSDAFRSDLSADGPPLGNAPDPMSIPDATPRIEPIVLGGANKPYEVAGRKYVPITTDTALSQRGMASWYGRKFHGHRTSSGEPYDMFTMSAAHTTMPLPSYARVRNPVNGREVVVRVNDRGPFAHDRVMDLSWAAASKLGIAGQVSAVEIRRLTNAEIQARANGTHPVAASSGGGPSSGSSGHSRSPATPPAAAAKPQLPAAAPGVTSGSSANAYWLQFGAFSQSEGAQGFKRELASKLEWLSPLLTVLEDGGLHRLQAGPYKSRDDARTAASRVKTDVGFSAMVVERR